MLSKIGIKEITSERKRMERLLLSHEKLNTYPSRLCMYATVVACRQKEISVSVLAAEKITARTNTRRLTLRSPARRGLVDRRRDSNPLQNGRAYICIDGGCHENTCEHS